jgi:hypothetical protein
MLKINSKPLLIKMNKPYVLLFLPLFWINKSFQKKPYAAFKYSPIPYHGFQMRELNRY